MTERTPIRPPSWWAGVIFSGIGVILSLLLIVVDAWLIGVIIRIVRGWTQ